jgi:hypothetical protein
VQAAGGAGRIIGLLEALFLVPPRFSFFGFWAIWVLYWGFYWELHWDPCRPEARFFCGR